MPVEVLINAVGDGVVGFNAEHILTFFCYSVTCFATIRVTDNEVA